MYICFLNELYNDLYSPNTFRFMKSGRMRWAGHVERMGNRRGAYRVLLEKSGGRDRLEYPGVYGRIILIWGFKTWDVGLDSINHILSQQQLFAALWSHYCYRIPLEHHTSHGRCKQCLGTR